MTKYIALLLACSLMVGCEPPTTPDQLPTPSPGDSGTPGPEASAVAIPTVNVKLEIQDQSGKKLSNAQVILSSDNQASQTLTTDAQGSVSFESLRKDTSYAIEVSAEGYFDATRTANLNELIAQGQQELLLAIILEAPKAVYTGRVVDAQGQPVVNASVFDTRQSVLTDKDGHFELQYANGGNLRLSIAKSGFEVFSRFIDIKVSDQNTSESLGTLNLSPADAPLTLGIDQSHSSSSLLSRYSNMQSQLKSLGYSVNTLSGNLLDQLQNLDALLILSPSKAFNLEEISAIQAFVLSGKKLIVTGEWGGFSGFSAQSANQLLAPFSLQFGVDTLNDNGVHLDIQSLNEHALTDSVSQLKLFTTGSVRITKPDANAQVVARSGAESFRIASNSGSFGVVVGAHFGAGKVVAIGDSSLWSDEDSTGSGSPNFFAAGNAKLLEQIMKW